MLLLPQHEALREELADHTDIFDYEIDLPTDLGSHGDRSLSGSGMGAYRLLFSMISGAYTFLLTPLSSLTSRKYEFEADEFASKNAKASKLISALVKLYKDNASTLTPDPLYSAFYHSHPPALIRVKYLESLIQKA